MHVIVPISLTDSDILDFSVKPDPYSVWENSVVYRRGRRVIVYGGINKIYESLYPNTDRYPPDNTDQEQPAWVLVRPVNLWSMLNPVPDQRTRGKDEIFVEVMSDGRITAVGAHGLEAKTIRVQVFDSLGAVVEDRTTNLTYSTIIDAATGEAAEGQYSEAAFMDLPAPPGGNVRVTIRNQGGYAYCESLTFGEGRRLGRTKPLATVNAIDPSLKEFDVFGKAYVRQRDMARGVTASVIVDWDKIDYCHKTLAGLRATPTTWVTAQTMPLSIVYGMYRDLEISLDNYRHGICRLDIKPIVYEPIKPPARPIEKTAFWTSRPYPFFLHDEINIGTATLTPVQAPLGISTDSVDFTNLQVTFADLRPPLVSYGVTESLNISSLMADVVDYRSIFKTVSAPDNDSINISSLSATVTDYRRILLSYHIGHDGLDETDVGSVNIGLAQVYGAVDFRNILKTLPYSEVDSLNVGLAQVTATDFRNTLRSAPPLEPESINIGVASVTSISFNFVLTTLNAELEEVAVANAIITGATLT